MVSTIFVCCALLAMDSDQDAGAPAAVPASDRVVYEAARSRAGKSADAHVRLALWCEERGLWAERVKHLSLAVLYDPANARARGLLGQVGLDGKWGSADEIGDRLKHDPARQATLSAYLERRAATPHKPAAQLDLAAWCEQHGLKEQAEAHYRETIQLDRTREAAWKHLGFKKQGNHWVKPEEAAAQKMEAERQKQADKQWKPRLERLRDALESKDAGRRARAGEELAQVTDPRAVPMIWSVFVEKNERSALAAVQMLGQIDSPLATSALAALAVFESRPVVRGLAASALARKDARDYVTRLIGLIRKPFKYQVRPVNGPGSTGELFVEGERFNIRRLYEFQPITNPRYVQDQQVAFVPSASFDPFGAQNVSLTTGTSRSAAGAMNSSPISGAAAAGAEAIATNQAAAPAMPRSPAGIASATGSGYSPSLNGFLFNSQAFAARANLQVGFPLENLRQTNNNLQERLMADVAMVETANAQINDMNDRALPLLKAATGQDLGADPEAWAAWWTDQQGYVYQSTTPATKPTYSDFVSVAAPGTSGHSACFAANTMVRTVDGPRAIESIQVGDRVLSQNVKTGVLTFQPVVGIHVSRPTPTLRLTIGDEAVVATGIHRFWKAGVGWTMARDLKEGDRVRVIGDTDRVRSVASDQIQPVYNLDIAENADFFVGHRGLLVHDFSFVQAVTEPFDGERDVASLIRPSSSAVAPGR